MDTNFIDSDTLTKPNFYDWETQDPDLSTQEVLEADPEAKAMVHQLGSDAVQQTDVLVVTDSVDDTAFRALS